MRVTSKFNTLRNRRHGYKAFSIEHLESNDNTKAFNAYLIGKYGQQVPGAKLSTEVVNIAGGGNSQFSPIYNSDPVFKALIDYLVAGSASAAAVESEREKLRQENELSNVVKRMHENDPVKKGLQEIGDAASKLVHEVVDDTVLAPIIPLTGGMKEAIKKAKYPDANPPNDRLNLVKEFFKKVILEEQFEGLEGFARTRGANLKKAPVSRKTFVTPKAPTGNIKPGAINITSPKSKSPFGKGAPVPPFKTGVPVNPAAAVAQMAQNAIDQAKGNGSDSGSGGGGSGDGGGGGAGDDQDFNPDINGQDDSDFLSTIMAQAAGNGSDDDNNGDDTGFGNTEDAVGEDDFSTDYDALEKEEKYDFLSGINEGGLHLGAADYAYLENATGKERELYRSYKLNQGRIRNLEALEFADAVDTAAAAAGTAAAGPAGGAAAETVVQIVKAIIAWFKKAHDKHQAGTSTPQEAAAVKAADDTIGKMSDAQKHMAAGENPFTDWFKKEDGTSNGMHIFEALLGFVAIVMIIIVFANSD